MNHRISNHLVWKRPPTSRSAAFDWSPPCQLDHSTECHSLNISTSADFTSFPSSAFQCLTTLSLKKFLMNFSLWKFHMTVASCHRWEMHLWSANAAQWAAVFMTFNCSYIPSLTCTWLHEEWRNPVAVMGVIPTHYYLVTINVCILLLVQKSRQRILKFGIIS